MLHRQSREFLRLILRVYPGRTTAMVAFLVLAGLAEGVGALSILPLLEVAAPRGTASAPSRMVAAALGYLGLRPTLATLLGLIVLGLTLKSLAFWLAMREIGYIVAQVAADLRLRLLRALLHARWSFFTAQPAGVFANSLSAEAHRAASAYLQAGLALAGTIRVLAYASLVLLISWKTALLALAGSVLLLRGLRSFVDLARSAGGRQTRVMRALIWRLTEALHAVKPLKAMAREDQLQARLEANVLELNQAQRGQVATGEALRALQEAMVVLLLAVGVFLLLAVEQVPLSVVLVLALLFQRIVGGVSQVQRDYQAMAAGESAFHALRRTAEEAGAATEGSGGMEPPPALRQGIRFQGVRFAHGEGWVLDGIDCVLPAGSLTVITGPSGSGKTTFADLLLGLHRPQAGEIHVDGVPLSRVDLRLWRRQLGYVPQEVVLFHDTILQNVTLGSPDLGRSEVEAALVAAGAAEFVLNGPLGMERVVGEAGLCLSGGQRQRIALARALVYRPRILILDEATAALDAATEADIFRTLQQLRGHTTIVLISHHPAARRIADQSFWLEQGHLRPIEPRHAGGLPPTVELEAVAG